jgi:hypothetical protein
VSERHILPLKIKHQNRKLTARGHPALIGIKAGECASLSEGRVRARADNLDRTARVHISKDSLREIANDSVELMLRVPERRCDHSRQCGRAHPSGPLAFSVGSPAKRKKNLKAAETKRQA